MPDSEEQIRGLEKQVSIENAGIVLVCAFIPRLFVQLELTDNGAFVSQEAAERAVHLLQYCVDGSSGTPEYLLGLNKVICGISPELPINPFIDVTAQEQELVRTMLSAIIERWKALGKTTVDGLQSSFLARSGRLQLKDSGWQLHVESRAFDMLLDSIPWSYTSARLPWMDKVLHVEWR